MTFNRARKLGGLKPGLSDAGAIELERTRGGDLYRGDRSGVLRGVRVRGARARMLAGASISSGAFLPDQISGLEIWLDADDASTVTTVDDGGTPRVSAWASKAGASRSFTQGTVANRPEYVSGLYLEFVSARFDELALSESSGLTWTNGTLFVAYQADNAGAEKGLFVVTEGNPIRFGLLLDSSEVGFLNVNASGDAGLATMPSGGTDLTFLAGHWEGGVEATVVDSNGLTSTDATFGAPISTYNELIVGNKGNGSSPMDGKIHEILFWPFRLNSSQLSLVFQYLGGKWGS